MAYSLRARLDAGETLYSGWLSTPAPENARAMAGGGLDIVTIDLQHGIADPLTMVRAIEIIGASGAIPLVRSLIRDQATIGRALVSGAEGVIAPMINSADDARWLADVTKFPPLGARSWGPQRINLLHGLESAAILDNANDWIVNWAMIETVEAVDAFDAIVGTPGIDGVFVGPSDLSISMSAGTTVAPNGDNTLAACAAIAEKARAAGRYAGIFATDAAAARRYRDMGFQFIAISNDLGLLGQGTQAVLGAIRAS